VFEIWVETNAAGEVLTKVRSNGTDTAGNSFEKWVKTNAAGEVTTKVRSNGNDADGNWFEKWVESNAAGEVTTKVRSNGTDTAGNSFEKWVGTNAAGEVTTKTEGQDLMSNEPNARIATIHIVDGQGQLVSDSTLTSIRRWDSSGQIEFLEEILINDQTKEETHYLRVTDNSSYGGGQTRAVTETRPSGEVLNYLEVRDDFSGSSWRVVVENNPPTDITLDNLSVTENSSGTTYVANITGTDPEGRVSVTARVCPPPYELLSVTRR
jgi:hypothetical protein